MTALYLYGAQNSGRINKVVIRPWESTVLILLHVQLHAVRCHQAFKVMSKKKYNLTVLSEQLRVWS